MTWKKGNLGGWDAGLSLWHVTGNINSGPWFLSNNKSFMNEAQSGNNFGDTSWNKNTSYSFDITYREGVIAVFIDEELEIAISAKDAGVDSFEDGGFAYFNFSQDNVYYHNVNYDEIDKVIDQGQQDAITSAVPVQGAGVMGLILAGLAGLSRRKTA